MPTALDKLKDLSKKKPAPAAVSIQTDDPALAGAKKDGSGILLGFDPAIAEEAAYAAKLKLALDSAEQEFVAAQDKMRRYGAEKRGAYNDLLHANVTTVKVPYTVDTPAGPEPRCVAVTCTNKYSVQSDVILGNKNLLGDCYDRLIREERTKFLKSNAEELVRGLLSEVGLSAEEVETSMQSLFYEQVAVKTTECYEQEVKKVPSNVRLLLDKVVRRQQPALKF